MEPSNKLVKHEESNPVSREQVLQLEDALREMPGQFDLNTFTYHHFAEGVYCRELFIPEGTVATGKIHRHQTMNILVYGDLRVTTDDGVKTLTGPKIFNSRPGTKKAVCAITDCLLLNIHPTNLTDLEEIENEFIVPSFEMLDHETMIAIGKESTS